MNYCRKSIYYFLFVIAFLFSSYNGYSQSDNKLSAEKQKLVTNYKASVEENLSLGNKSLAADNYNKIAYIYWENNILQEALSEFQKSLQLNIELNNQNAIRAINENIGLICVELKQWNNAIAAFRKSLAINKQTGDKSRTINNLINIAIILANQGKHSESNTEAHSALNIAKEQNNMNALKSCYGILAENCEQLGDGNKAQEYLDLYVSIYKYLKENKIKELEENVKHSQAVRNATESELKRQSGKLKATTDSLKAIEKLIAKQQLEIELLAKDRQLQEEIAARKDVRLKSERLIRNLMIAGIAVTLCFSVLLLFQFNQKKKVNILLEEQKMAIEQQADLLEHQNHELEQLSIVAKYTDNSVLIVDSRRNFKWANEGFSRLWGYSHDEIDTDSGKQILKQINTREEDIAYQQCAEKKHSVTFTRQSKNKKGRKVWVQTMLTPVMDKMGDIIKYIAIDSNITKIKIAEQKIHDSIIYASNIQRAILPQKDVIDHLLHDYFVVYLPKDIVSGDFYWVTTKGNKLICAAGDCTGHGVPGAFMSLLSITFLNDTVEKAGKSGDTGFQANEILNELRKKIIFSLHQQGKAYEAKDGLDIALCIIDYDTNTLQYAGAYNPLFLYRKDSENKYRLMEVKGDRMSVCYPRHADHSFTNHTLMIKPDDTIYLFSDGFTDQFGGAEKQKYTMRRLREFLLSVQDRSMEEQKSLIEKDISGWRGDINQTDDIVMLGIKPELKVKHNHDIATYNWENKSILIAEDVEMNFRFMKGFLSATKVNIIHAENGAQAVEISKTYKDIDLILMDIKMPVMDGYEATRNIRQLLPQLPVIALTAYAIFDENEKALKAGYNDVITKPINIDYMLKTLDKYLS